MAGWYDRHVLPKVICAACASKPITKQREKIVPLARGRVLELGIGGGLNLRHYDPTVVWSVAGVDPSPELRARAAAAPRPEGLNVDVREGTAEALPFPDATFDDVVCTFTLCSVRDPAASLAEVRRVLRRGGRLLVCEHGLAPDGGVQQWQRRIEPVWKRIAGGCHLTRPVTGMLASAGFRTTAWSTMYLPSTPRIAGWNEWGVAEAA
jgi:ubiquinone/menaquinone biosynthesis C-methylase UbiE